MATVKWANNKVMESGLTWIKSSATHYYVVDGSLSATPTYAECTSTHALAGPVAWGSVDGSITSGDASGRKLPILAASSVSCTGTGAAAGVAIVRSVSSAVMYVTVLSTSVSVTSSGTVNIATWDIEITAPS